MQKPKFDYVKELKQSAISEYLASIGRLGGQRRATNPDRSRLASEAAKARWNKEQQKKQG